MDKALLGLSLKSRPMFTAAQVVESYGSAGAIKPGVKSLLAETFSRLTPMMAGVEIYFLSSSYEKSPISTPTQKDSGDMNVFARASGPTCQCALLFHNKNVVVKRS